MNYFFLALRRFNDFGRSRRKEYWTYFPIIILLIAITAFAVERLPNDSIEETIGLFLALAVFALFLPAISLTIRRLHDTGRTGWWILLNLIPYVGSIILLILLALPGQQGDNKYGPDPRKGLPVHTSLTKNFKIALAVLLIPFSLLLFAGLILNVLDK